MINKGMRALTTPDECQQIADIKQSAWNEFKEKHHSADCVSSHPRLLFAFWQKDFKGGRIPYWHVMNSHRSQFSTLSYQGLKEWGVIQ